MVMFIVELMLLCSCDVEDAFADDIMSDASTDQRYIKLSDVRNPPIFWVSDGFDMPLITNACESYHSHLKRVFTCIRIQILVF
jgi:hypothetical protein